MLRILAILGGVAGGVSLSQFPEFSQQYLQRLAGQVDALSQVVTEFDSSAARNGLSREAALAEMTGTAFLNDRHDDLQRVFARYDRLSANLTALREATPLARLAMPQRLADPQTLSATWADFRPAMPVTADGGICAVGGYLAGWAVVAGLFAGLGRLFRRQRPA